MSKYEQRLRAVLDNPHSSTAAYRQAWNEMQQLQFQQRCDQHRYDAQIDKMVAAQGSSNCFAPCAVSKVGG